MPKNIAQWTGLAVTAIIVLGSDHDVFYAMPLGIMAGALATFFAGLGEEWQAQFALARRLRRYRT